MSKLETAPIFEMKTGVWVNRKKMRSALEKISMYYGILFTGFGVFAIMNGSYVIGAFQIIMSLPLWIIQFSYIKWQRARSNEGK